MTTPDLTQLEGWELTLLRAAHQMSLSEAQYALICERYEQLQGILAAATNPLLREAHIFVQGSMRLKTTIKPAPGAEGAMATIDADAVVWLPHAQGASAQDVLKAIEDRFRAGTRVTAPIEQLRRGIRIIYSDENPGFHIDITPARCVPGNGAGRGEGGLQVPDRELGWKASSPLPYANWLSAAADQDIRLANLTELAKRQVVFAEASQDPLPDYEDYTDANPLRATIKLIKRHRDEWAIRHDKEATRPISAVLTTLAAAAYAEVAAESRLRPYRPIEAIMAIVDRMPNFISHGTAGYEVCNPTDPGENFAEKWNRPGREGEGYRAAFSHWHAEARDDVRLGLRDLGSTTAFTEAMSERFGVSRVLVETVARELPGNWTLPGRAAGVTANTTRLGALVGGSAASGASQSQVRPVDRLG
jgi:hypothetical protein